MTTTNGWDLVVGFNQDYLTSSITQLYEDGTFPSSFNQGVYNLTLTQPSLTISTTTSNTIVLGVPFYGTQGPQSIKGSLTIGVDVSQLSAAIVSQPDYLQMSGGASDVAKCGTIGPITSSSCTLEAWIKTTTTSGQNILVFGSETPGLSLSNNRLSLLWGDSNPSGDTSNVSDGNWHHIAVVVATDPTTSIDTITYYKDGQAKDSVPLFGGTTQTSTGDFRLGSAGASVGSFNGAMTQVRVWKTARTAQQIQQAMNTEISSTEAGLLGYWTFTDDTITNLVDGQAGVPGGSAAVEHLASPPSASYLYVLDLDSAFTVTSDVNGSDNKALDASVQTALAAYFAEPRITPLESNGNSALLPTLTSFITLTDQSNAAANRLLALMMTDHTAPPSGDPNQDFANDTQLQIPADSNMVAALWDYIFFSSIVAPAVAKFLHVSASQIVVTAGDPSSLSFSGSVSINDGVQISSLKMNFNPNGLYIGIKGTIADTLINMTMSTTMNIEAGPATTAADETPQNLLLMLQQSDPAAPERGYRVTLHNPYGEGGAEQINLTFIGTYLSLQWNQSNPAVITVEALAATFPFIGICLLPCCAAILTIVQNQILNKLNNFKKAIPYTSSDKLYINDIQFNDGLIIFGTLTPGTTS